MIKNCVKRKLIITTFALLIFLITLTFPRTEEEIKNVTITYTEAKASPIYLLNNEEFVSRTNVSIKSETTIDQAKEIIETLTIDNAKAAYIPNFFFITCIATSNTIDPIINTTCFIFIFLPFSFLPIQLLHLPPHVLKLK